MFDDSRQTSPRVHHDQQRARTFIDEFTLFYNHDHHHTGIGLHTPADVHDDLAAATDQRRHHALATARIATPERFTTATNPKILNLPAAGWINPPIQETTHQDQEIQETAA